jgi:hypothetical protein
MTPFGEEPGRGVEEGLPERRLGALRERRGDLRHKNQLDIPRIDVK